MFWRTLLSLTLMVALTTSPAWASTLLDQIARDFKPLSGYVIMPADGEYLIDQDARQGVAPGDLFTVVQPGEKIIHPVTQEVLGTLDQTKAVLRVTRIQSGYSYAVPLEGGGEVSRGDVIRRYQGLPAVPWDYTGRGEAFFGDLKARLPALEWQDYAVAQQQRPAVPGLPPDGTSPQLVFLLRHDGLQVLGPDSQVIHSYDLPQSLSAVQADSPGPAPSPAPVRPAVPAPEAPTPAVATAPPSPILRQERQPAGAIWYSPDFSGVATGLEVGDFDGDGRQEIATLFPHRLEIARLTGESYAPLATLDLGLGQKALRADGVDLDRDGRMELFITAAGDGNLRSLMVAWREGRYRILQDNIRWYLRVVSLPGEGRVLLGQRLGAVAGDYRGPVFRVELDGDGLAEGTPLELPRNVINIFGFLPFTTAGGEQLTAYLGDFDRLKIVNARGESLWESEDYFGGSETYFPREDPNLNPASGDTIRHVYIQQRIEPGLTQDLVIPANIGNRFFDRFLTFKKSTLKGMTWNGHTLMEVWQTQPQDAYLADFRLADADNDGDLEVVQSLVFTREGFFSKGRSALAILEMN